MKSNAHVLVCFLPFWEPHFSYASSRLRAVFPAKMLGSRSNITARIGWAEGAQIYVVVQLCSDRMLGRLTTAKARGARIAYVVCDRHFADDASFAGVNAKWRFAQLAELADVFLVPTTQMQRIIRQIENVKPVVVIPDCTDYSEFQDPTPVPAAVSACWFGNPGKGNFAAAEPYLKWLLGAGFNLNIISRKESFQKQEAYKSYVYDWEYGSFVGRLRHNSFSVIAFSPDELQKSENRLVTSVMNGVPAIVSGASSSADALSSNGLGYAAVNGLDDFAQAVRQLQTPEYRNVYLTTMQSYFGTVYADETIAENYVSLIQDLVSQ